LIVTLILGAPFKGDLSFLFFASIVYVICTTSIGLMISTLVRTQIAAELITGVATVFPTFNYSGLLKPIESMSTSDQIVAHLLPSMYFTEILHGSFLKGLGWAELWLNVVILACYALVLLFISGFVFRKRPSR
jgi:ABC-2 type transport system permease protein/ribosome-dependent ATPase